MCTRQEDKERGLESWHDGEQAARTEEVRKLSETLNEHLSGTGGRSSYRVFKRQAEGQ